MERGLIATAMMLVVTIIIAGCGSDGSGSLVSTADQYQQKVYVVGEITASSSSAIAQAAETQGLAGETNQIFVNQVPYNGTATDAPIFITADSIATLSDTVKQGIRNTYQNFFPIVVVQGTQVDINALLGIAGLTQNYTLPEGMTYAELFAIDLEQGASFSWVMYPPVETPLQVVDGNILPIPVFTDNQYDRLKRVGMLRDWMKKDGNRITAANQANKTAAIQALANATTETYDLESLAKSYNAEVTFSERGNNYTLTYEMYAVHSFNATDATDYDWFYVYQSGTLNSSGGYGGLKHNYQVYGNTNTSYRDYVGEYVGGYALNNYFDGVSSGVTLYRRSPENANNTDTVTSEVSFSLEGTIGFDGKTPSVDLTPGINFSRTREVKITDCEVTNNSGDAGHNAKWSFGFKKPEQTADWWYCHLSEPALYAHGSFSPINQWIWKVAPSVRDSNKTSFRTEFNPGYAATLAGYPKFLFTCTDITHEAHGVTRFAFDVPLTYPPLLSVTKNVDFSAAGQYKSLDIGVSRNWTATSSDSSWCRVDPTSGTGNDLHINVTVDPNNTGASRKTTIVFSTADGKATDTMTVFQSQY